MKMYSSYQTTMEEPITNWLHVTKADFDAFHCSDTCFNATKFDITPTISTPRHDSLSDFKKGIKWDASLFTILKDPKQWDSWHQSTMAQARAQDVFKILDPSYAPNQTEEPLFEAKQMYLYTVFERVLQTNKGKVLVCAYEETADAQQIFKDLWRCSQIYTFLYWFIQNSFLHHLHKNWRWSLEWQCTQLYPSLAGASTAIQVPDWFFSTF